MKTPGRSRPQSRSVADVLSQTEAREVADAVIQVRKRTGMTQAEIAKAMGITQSAFARLESAATLPSMSTLQRFARATSSRLHLSIDPVSDHDIRTASHTMTDTLPRPRFSADRRGFLGGAMGLAGLLGLGNIRQITAEEATAAAEAAQDYAWTPPQYDPEPSLFTVLERNDQVVTVETIDGIIEIPANPTRIASLGGEYTSLFEIGITNSIVVVGHGLPDFLPFNGAKTEELRSALKDAAIIANPWEPDLEEVASHDPDLILVSGSWIQDVTLFNQIAPTIRTPTHAIFAPRAAVRDFGSLLGRSEAAEMAISEHDQFIARAREAIASVTEHKKAAVISPYEDTLTVYASYYIAQNGIYSFFEGAYQLHRELGITPSSFIEQLADDNSRPIVATISVEQLGNIDADYIFVADQSGEFAFLDNPALQSTFAAQKDQVYPYEPTAEYGLNGDQAAVTWIVEQLTGEPFA